MAWIDRHDHSLFVKRVRPSSPLIFATCRCDPDWCGPVRDDRVLVDQDFRAHVERKTLRPAGEL